MKIANKALLIFTIIFSIAFVTFGQTAKKESTQTFLKGNRYFVFADELIAFNYTRTYSRSGGNFITTYKIYDPADGMHDLTITATHDPNTKKVVVMKEYADPKTYAPMGSEETTYDAASLEPFGVKGSDGESSDINPHQLKVKFTSSKFENINVCQILALRKSNDTEFFLLDDE